MTTLSHDRDSRILSIDLLRGIVMLIMALDHTRDFFHIAAITSSPTDLGTTTAPLFFTRWITHFCAPVFVFLSGMSAYLAGQRKTKKQLSLFLIKRGVWLILVEVFVISLALSFNPLYNFVLLQVIWAIGWSMIILGLLIHAGYAVVAIAGVILFFGHNIFDFVPLPTVDERGIFWNVLLRATGTPYFYRPDRLVMVAYAILPWTGVMLLGFSFGKIFGGNTLRVTRRRVALNAGLALTGLFIFLRLLNGYGDPAPWSVQETPLFSLLSFLNVNKYPPSLDYCCMTIGPALIFLSLTDRLNNRLTAFFSVYGKVPFFYYVLHFFLIHIICVILFFATGFGSSQIVSEGSPFLFRPVNFGFSLPWVYVIWLVVILSLYYPCKWFAKYKATHDQWWLAYL